MKRMVGLVGWLFVGGSVLAGEPQMINRGADWSRGVLVNRSCGPIDPAKPTIVLIHGMNATPGKRRLVMADMLLCGRDWSCWNVLEWNWNAATFDSLLIRRNLDNAIDQGRRLACCLQQQGIDPARTTVIGHSLGCVVATSATRELSCASQRCVAKLVLLDGPIGWHKLIYDELKAKSHAVCIDDVWAPGPSAFGGPSNRPGVNDIMIRGSTPIRGMIRPRLSSHVEVAERYLKSLTP